MTRSAGPVAEAQTSEDLLVSLKDLKNGVIGNTWRKVEVVENRQLLARLVGILDSDHLGASHDDIVSETAVIVGALANIGSLTVRPLIVAGIQVSLLTNLQKLSRARRQRQRTPAQKRLAGHLLRALRNLLVAAADVMWGSLWGVGAEKKVVSTGLRPDEDEEEQDDDEGPSPGTRGGSLSAVGTAQALALAQVAQEARAREWREEATRALSLCFEEEYLECLMTFIEDPCDYTLSLPVFQLFERLAALPSNCRALLHFQLDASTQHIRDPDSPLPDATIVDRILLSIVQTIHPPSYNFRTHSRLLSACVGLLAVLTRADDGLDPTAAAGRRLVEEEWDDDDDESGDLLDLLDKMISDAPTSVRISALHCLTNYARSAKVAKNLESVPSPQRLARATSDALTTISMLVKSESLDDGIKLCFILAELAGDDDTLQKDAYHNGTTQLLISSFINVHQAELKGEVPLDVSTRAKEAYLLALASLSSLFEPARAQIAEASPPVLPLIKEAVGSESYGIRAAACQLARSLSRTIAILRTSLLDSGVGLAVIETLKEEVQIRAIRTRDQVEEDPSSVPREEDAGERRFTVQVAATAAICNLVTDFSPLRDTVVQSGGIELMCHLAQSSFEPLALNALWALKNFTFRAPENIKEKVVQALGYPSLQQFIGHKTKLTLRIQALKIIQNIMADSLPSELGSLLAILGDNHFLTILVESSREGQDMELRETCLTLFANLALGNERARMALASRVDIVELLSESMNCPVDRVKLPAIKALRYLVESNPRTQRPRQSMLDLLQPYHLRPRLEELAETSASLDVSQNALGLLTVIKRGRERVDTPSGMGESSSASGSGSGGYGVAGSESGEGTGSGTFSARMGGSRNAIFH